MRILLAISYLRVSTREQAERGGTDEGFSIPAQGEANSRKADELGARVVREFVDAGGIRSSPKTSNYVHASRNRSQRSSMKRDLDPATAGFALRAG